jgi:hypothetical protein
MLKQLIGIIRSIAITAVPIPAIAQSVGFATLADFPESTAPAHFLSGNGCSTIVETESKKILQFPCIAVRTTGVFDKHPLIFIHFLDEYGNGTVIVTKRFVDGKVEPIVAFGEVASGKVVKIFSVKNQGNCTFDTEEYKIGCFLKASGNSIGTVLHK